MVPLEKTDPLIGDLMEQVGVSGDRVVIQTTRDDVHVTIRRMPKSARTLQNGFVMRSVSGTTRIFHPVWTQRMVDHYALRLERERVNRARFHEVAEAWFRTSREGLGVVMEEIIQRDIVFSRAEAVRMYHLTRPVYQSDQSGLVCRNLRNPIVEAVQPSVRFVTNDFAMADGKTGMLLFGQNSAGKSTYVKSIGMNVWLAQTGHFVFADEFRAGRPFEKILTKLSIQDNLFRGISTFQNEMMDLRYILARSVERPSLILSDELTAGTETWSATAIIASTLHELLHRQNTTFVFTTHLHTLQLYQEVYGHASLQAAHIRFSKSGSSDPDFRKILPGEGPVMYGIEIAEDLGFSPEFISRCFHYRQRMEGHIQVIAGMSGENNNLVSLRPSRYNRLVKMDRCEKCGSTKSLHAHHKHHQNDAVKHPFSPGKIIPGTGGQSIHSAWNLRVLCQSCHHDEHRG